MNENDVIERRRATCRHCEETLLEVDGAWIDDGELGSPVCISGATWLTQVDHAPMPDGFTGAPW